MENNDFRKTHPLVLGAAASVMVVSLVGAAAIGGLLPNARSDRPEANAQILPGAGAASAPSPNERPGRSEAPAPRHTTTADSARHGMPKPAARDGACASCGTVEAIHAVELKGNATGLGAVAGGVTGAVVGNQIGHGHGNTAMTIIGAAGGAFAGNEIEKNVKKHYSYRVTVRMDDGSFRALPQSAAPTVAIGERVRVVGGALVARS